MVLLVMLFKIVSSDLDVTILSEFVDDIRFGGVGDMAMGLECLAYKWPFQLKFFCDSGTHRPTQ